jgi:hypothetical protein
MSCDLLQAETGRMGLMRRQHEHAACDATTQVEVCSVSRQAKGF